MPPRCYQIPLRVICLFSGYLEQCTWCCFHLCNLISPKHSHEICCKDVVMLCTSSSLALVVAVEILYNGSGKEERNKEVRMHMRGLEELAMQLREVQP